MLCVYCMSNNKGESIDWQGEDMLYVNVPLPKPLVDKIDEIISNQENSFRSRPDFILQHIRDVVDKRLERQNIRLD